MFSSAISRLGPVLKEKLRKKMIFQKKTKEMLNSVKSIMCTYSFPFRPTVLTVKYFSKCLKYLKDGMKQHNVDAKIKH